MTKKHLIFPIHTYPDEVPPPNNAIVVLNQIGGGYTYCIDADTLIAMGKIYDGDTYINLSEGEVVDNVTVLEGVDQDYNKKTFVKTFEKTFVMVSKEQEGDE